MRTTCTLLCAAFLFSTGYPLDALAQPKTSVTAQVGELFDQAQAAFAKGDKQGAYDAYTAAWALQKSYDIAGNLGNVEVKLGKYRDAAEHLAFALENFPPTGEEAQQKAMERKLAEVLKEVGRLHVQVSANGAKVDGASVTVNGRPASTAPSTGTLFVEPGPIVVEVKLAGYVDGRQQVAIAKGEERSMPVALVPLPTLRRSVVPGAVLGGVGGAALVAGLGLFVAGRVKLGTAHDLNTAIIKAGNSCVTGAGNYDASCQELYGVGSMSNTFQQAGAGLMIGGGAAVAGALIYFVLPPPRSSASSSGMLRVIPTVSPAFGGLVFSGAF